MHAIAKAAATLAWVAAFGLLTAGPDAQAQPIPPELRARAQALQERERALLAERHEWNTLVNDARTFFILVPTPVGHYVVPVDVDALSQLTLRQLLLRQLTNRTPYLAPWTSTARSVSDGIRPMVEFDRATRQQIRQSVLPELEAALTRTREEFADLLSRPGGVQTEFTFVRPKVDDVHRVDACVNWGGWCDQFAADRWCQLNGFARSNKWEPEKADLTNESTKTLGDGRVCNLQTRPPSGCGTFKFITCTR
jgi:hypothetical protein